MVEPSETNLGLEPSVAASNSEKKTSISRTPPRKWNFGSLQELKIMKKTHGVCTFLFKHVPHKT